MKVLRKRDVIGKVGLSLSTIYRLEGRAEFPRRIKLGLGCIGWLEDEIDDWIADRAAERCDARPS
ncbi:MAG TPA: AlpA family phage regulatory protein [Alphaproteobacteria bacterium]|nr:AlpA family phage regulatory protein [Alphaproteobacteria bacterium]